MDAVKGNIQLKQGYLDIKRERNSTRFSTRGLSKPWQRAYFILYQEPIFFNEYKDASLKQMKHIHILNVIKHVGQIKTSKSKPYAFAIIYDEKQLLLACENQSLLDEWIKAFTEVMIKRKMQIQSNCSLTEYPNEKCKEYAVEIVETTLSGMNNLHGEYMAGITNSRMHLRDPDEGVILSWSLMNIAGHRCEASQNRVILVMGKNCHFGKGKLILASKEYTQILTLLNNNIGEKRRKIHATLSSPEVSPMRSLAKPTLHDPIDEETESDLITINSSGITFSKGGARTKTNLHRIKSCPNMQDPSPHVQSSYSDIHRAGLRSIQESCPNLDEPDSNIKSPNHEPSTKVKLARSPVKNFSPITFPETSSDGGYIPPDNLHLPAESECSKQTSNNNNKNKNNDNVFLLSTSMSTSMPDDVNRSPLEPPAINENDSLSYPYLHIIDDDMSNNSNSSNSNSNKDTLKIDDVNQIDHLRTTITDELSNPQKPPKEVPIFAPIGVETHIDERRTSSPLPSRKKEKLEQPRRPSEPIKKSVFEPFRNKHKMSCTEQQVPVEGRRQSSPRLSPKQPTTFPKLISMQQGDVFQQMATTSLILQKIPKSDIMPGLPPHNGSSLPSQRSRPTSRDLDTVSVSVEVDQPPPLPYRGSPEPLQGGVQHQLSYNITIREEPTNKARRNTMSDFDSSRNHTITVNSRRTYNPPPPIPPKTKLLSRSAAISESKDESSCDTSRRSSYADDTPTTAVSTDDDNNYVIKEEVSTPPAVPKRNYKATKSHSIVTPDNGLTDLILKRHKRPSPLQSKPPMSKSLDSLSFPPPACLTFPEDEEKKGDSSPPPHRRASPSNSPTEDAVIIEGDVEIPSISITTLPESPEEEE